MPEQIKLKKDLWCGKPRVVYSYKSKPSWKTYGDGVAVVDVTVENDGGVYLICKEIPSEGRSKEVYVSLSKEAVDLLLKSLPQHIKALQACRDLNDCIDDCKGHGTPIIKSRTDCYLAMHTAREVLK